MPEGGAWKDLLKSSGKGDLETIRCHLLKKEDDRVDPNYQHPEYFTSPIFEAIRSSQTEAVKVLIEEGGANPDLVEDLTDLTPIDVALLEGHHDIVDYLNSKLPPARRWRPHHILVITNHNPGEDRICKDICTSLLKKGHRVVFTCCSELEGNKMLKELKALTTSTKIDFMLLGDNYNMLTTSSSIQATTINQLALSIKEKLPNINAIINHQMTSDPAVFDSEQQAFMNVLTNQLHPLLIKNGPSRIILMTPRFSHHRLLDYFKRNIFFKNTDRVVKLLLNIKTPDSKHNDNNNRSDSSLWEPNGKRQDYGAVYLERCKPPRFKNDNGCDVVSSNVSYIMALNAIYDSPVGLISNHREENGTARSFANHLFLLFLQCFHQILLTWIFLPLMECVKFYYWWKDDDDALSALSSSLASSPIIADKIAWIAVSSEFEESS